jgi:CheY-like chemotaxis protein
MHLWSNKPRILVADRSEQMIQAVAKILGKEFEVVGFARDGEETLRTVIHLKPDVVVMDIIMPMLDGMAVERDEFAH